jgi:hypothetical protein
MRPKYVLNAHLVSLFFAKFTARLARPWTPFRSEGVNLLSYSFYLSSTSGANAFFRNSGYVTQRVPPLDGTGRIRVGRSNYIVRINQSINQSINQYSQWKQQQRLPSPASSLLQQKPFCDIVARYRQSVSINRNDLLTAATMGNGEDRGCDGGICRPRVSRVRRNFA